MGHRRTICRIWRQKSSLPRWNFKLGVKGVEPQLMEKSEILVENRAVKGTIVKTMGINGRHVWFVDQ